MASPHEGEVNLPTCPVVTLESHELNSKSKPFVPVLPMTPQEFSEELYRLTDRATLQNKLGAVQVENKMINSYRARHAQTTAQSPNPPKQKLFHKSNHSPISTTAELLAEDVLV